METFCGMERILVELLDTEIRRECDLGVGGRVRPECIPRFVFVTRYISPSGISSRALANKRVGPRPPSWNAPLYLKHTVIITDTPAALAGLKV